jgi:uncharacterized protein (UPF0332 family)
MKEQTSAYLDKARELLDRADTMLSVNLNEAAGRTAYLAGFHPAQAFISETNDRVYKTHGGLVGEFARLVKGAPALTNLSNSTGNIANIVNDISTIAEAGSVIASLF